MLSFLWGFLGGTFWDTFWRLPVSQGDWGWGRFKCLAKRRCDGFLQLKSLQALAEIWNLPPESFVMSVGATNEPEAVNRVGFLPFLVLSARSLNCSPDPLDAKNPTRAITLSLSCPLSHWKDPTTTTDAKTVVHLIIFWRLQMCRLFYTQSTIGVNIVDILE